MLTKWYVVSGELQRLVLAETPQLACEKALELSHGEEIDSHYFFVDERGFRDGLSELKAEWIIEIDDIMVTQGQGA